MDFDVFGGKSGVVLLGEMLKFWGGVVELKNVCIFAAVYESCKLQEMHYDVCPCIEIRQVSGGGIEHLCFRLCVYAVYLAYRQA